MTATLKIGIFDSGLGGLSVYRALRQQLPYADLLYVADSAYAPYGIRNADYVRKRSHHIAHFLVKEQAVDALVIACNTATAAAARSLRANYTLPVIAMEPGLKPAIAQSHNGIIAVLATQGTLASQQFMHLRERFAVGVQVIDLPCPGWVELVERGEHHSDKAKQRVATTLAPVLDAGADTLVLGCTHFPFLRDAIRLACPPDIQLIETADAVARQVICRLADTLSTTVKQRKGTESFWSSGEPTTAQPIMEKLLGYPITLQPLGEP